MGPQGPVSAEHRGMSSISLPCRSSEQLLATSLLDRPGPRAGRRRPRRPFRRARRPQTHRPNSRFVSARTEVAKRDAPVVLLEGLFSGEEGPVVESPHVRIELIGRGDRVVGTLAARPELCQRGGGAP
jgi:hypothetical protein